MINSFHILSNQKVLVVTHSLACGGIEKSVLALLSHLVANGNIVTLALCDKTGEFLPFVPNTVTVIEIPYSKDVRDEIKYGRKRQVIRFLLRFRFGAAYELFRFGQRISRLSADKRAIAICQRYCRSLPVSEATYDAAYCFSEFTELVYVADYVKANKKAVWLHTEQGQGFSNVREYSDYLEKMDEIYCVSDALCESVKKALPALANHVKRYHHIVDVATIHSMADKEMADWTVSEGTIRILSVGRLAWQKGFDLVIPIARRLKDAGHKFSWMILGEGSERGALERKREEYGVVDSVLLPGVRTNPYPYFKVCDIYVQPSRYEGYCLTVAEARAFCKPIIVTDFNGAREQLQDGKTGYVISADNMEELNERLIELICRRDIRERFSKALHASVCDRSEYDDMRSRSQESL